MMSLPVPFSNTNEERCVLFRASPRQSLLVCLTRGRNRPAGLVGAKELDELSGWVGEERVVERLLRDPLGLRGRLVLALRSDQENEQERDEEVMKELTRP